MKVSYVDYFRSILQDEDPDNPNGRMITYCLNPKSHFVDATEGDTWSITSGAQVVRVRLFALEPFNTASYDVSSSGLIILFGLPVKNDTGTQSCVAQQSTELMPSADPQWRQVGSWSADTTLRDSNIDLIPANSSGQAIAKVVALEAVSMGVADQPVLFRIEYDTLETLPLITVNRLAVAYEDSADFWATTPTQALSDHDVMAEIKGVTNLL
jgi:hypothetical protein